MKNSLILIFKGIIIGIGQIIPGVSGGMLAITLGLYEKGIEIISNIFKNTKNNFHFLLMVGSGILLSVIFCSKLIKFSLIKFYLPTMLLFIGLIFGGVPSLIKKINNYNEFNISNIMITVVTFIIITILSLVNSGYSNNLNNIFGFIIFIIVGFIYAATMVIPGISGTAIMMLIGYYDIIINMISNLSNISITFSNLNIVIPFSFGLVLGIIYVSRFMDYILKKHEIKTHYFIMGLVSSSIFIMFIQTFKVHFDIISLIIGLLLLIIGYYISRFLDRL